MNKPLLLQKRIVWKAGHWSLLLAWLGILCFFSGAWFVAAPAAATSLYLGIRGSGKLGVRGGGTIFGLLGVAFSIAVLVLLTCLMTPFLYNLLAP